MPFSHRSSGRHGRSPRHPGRRGPRSDGRPHPADAVALGEADETWPQIVNDAVSGQLKEIYTPVDDAGKERKPSLKQYPVIPPGIHRSRSVQSCPEAPDRAAPESW